MKERPILFSGPMVRAILEGRKTQTRRIAKISADTAAALDDAGDGWSWEFGAEGYGGASRSYNGGRFAVPMRCPFGGPGDRLWVRETHAIAGQLVAYDADGWCGAVCDDGGGGLLRIPHGFVSTSGSDAIRRGCDGKNGARFGIDRFGGKWRPSIHMPRWASRLTLAVTAVRVERLQAISEDDARAEGIPDRCDHGCSSLCSCASCIEGGCQTAAAQYATLWDDINGDRAAWSSNPWVWVVEFKRIGGAP